MFCKNCGSQVPDGIAFCAACGTAVPGAGAAKNDKQGLIKLVAIIVVAAIVLGLFISLLGGGSAKSVAKKYIKAEIEGDIKTMMKLEPGKMLKMFEKEMTTDEKEEMFKWTEEAAKEAKVDMNVKNFNQYYKASKKIQKANLEESFGKYKVKVEVVDTKDMRPSEIEMVQEQYDDDDYSKYINPDKIKKGKKVYVRASIEGDKDSESTILVAYVVKYGGKWKVAATGPDDRDN